MTNAQIAIDRISNMPDSDVALVLDFIDGLEGDEPNEETIEALREAEDLDSLTECADLRDMLVKCGVKNDPKTHVGVQKRYPARGIKGMGH